MCRKCDEVPIHRILRQPVVDTALLEEEARSGAMNLRSPCGKSPLMTAAYMCHKHAIDILVRYGAVVNAIDETTGDTAAHFVTLSLSGHIRQCGCMMQLLEHGAAIDLRNTDGYTVFELATKNGNKDIGNTGNAMMRGPDE
jgi:ankyrin repeat protein